MPIHPMIVHFPIAFCVLEFFCLLRWQWKKDPTYLRFARGAFFLTLAVIPVAMAAGLYDTNGLKGIRGEVREHVIAALVFLGATVVRFPVWRFGKKEGSPSAFLLLASSLVALAAMMVTSYRGGELVYHHG